MTAPNYGAVPASDEPGRSDSAMPYRPSTSATAALP